MRQVISFLLCLLLFVSCNTGDRADIDTTNVKLDVIIKRADIAGLKVKTDDDLDQWFNSFPKLHAFFVKPFQSLKPEMRIENERRLHKSFLSMLSNEEIHKLVETTHLEFGDFTTLEFEFNDAFKRFKYYDSSFVAPEVNTLVSGFGSFDCNLSGDLLIVGLEYFLNDKTKYYDFEIPNYALTHYKQENILPKSIQLLQDRINAFDPLDQTLLSQMVYYGKADYFATIILPNSPERVILEYTPEEMEKIKQQQEIIYSHFVNNKLFYQEGQEVIARYVNLRPSVAEIGNECPGRIGRWLGYQIVKKYMKDYPDVTLMQLMADTDAKKIFAKAKYKPSKE